MLDVRHGPGFTLFSKADSLLLKQLVRFFSDGVSKNITILMYYIFISMFTGVLGLFFQPKLQQILTNFITNLPCYSQTTTIRSII